MTGSWNQRRSLDLDLLDPESNHVWQSDGDRYVSFLVDIEPSPTLDSLCELAESLAGFECLAVPDTDYYHVTLKQVGFLVDDPEEADEVTRDDISEIADAARAVFDETESFSISFPRLNLFPSVVFSEVEDEGRLKRVHERLLDVDGVHEGDFDGDEFLPHLTLGHFVDEAEYDALVDWMEANRTLDVPDMRVDSVELAVDDPDSDGASFETIARFGLGE